MAGFSPKIEIINHFDNLINKVDVDIDSCLENYNGETVLRELLTFNEMKEIENKRNYNHYYNIFVKFYDTCNSLKLDSWPETTKVVDYLKQIRITTVEELRKAQEDTLEYYKLNSSRLKSELNDEKNIDQLKRKLFAEKFYFQVHFTKSKLNWAFKIFTFVTDFYMSPSDIETLEKLLNYEEEPFCPNADFDEKTVLIALLYKFFFENLLNIPNHFIHVRKQDVLKIETLRVRNNFSRVSLTDSSIDLSKIVDLEISDRNMSARQDSIEINIDGLCSLKNLVIGICNDKTIFSTNFWSGYSSQSIERLVLFGEFSYFNFDKFLNLKRLTLNGTINEDFNLDLFKNLCNQLESLSICYSNIYSKTSFKLFDGYHFPYLQYLKLDGFFIKNVNKNFINRFPFLKRLYIKSCHLETIEGEAFSDLKQLNYLGLSGCFIYFGKNAFSNTKNLKTLDLRYNLLINGLINGLTHLDREYIGLEDSVEIIIDKNENFMLF